MVANRFLLLALFAACQTAACGLDIVTNLENGGGVATAGWVFATFTAVEVVGAVVLWLAFFPPHFYQRRIATSAAAAGG